MYNRNLQLWLHPDNTAQGGRGEAIKTRLTDKIAQEDKERGEVSSPNYEELIKTDKELVAFMEEQIAHAMERYEQSQKARTEEQVTKEEQLATMNERERAVYEQKKQSEEIAQLKDQIATRGRKDMAVTIANEKGLPVSLLEVIDFANMKEEEVSKTVEQFKTAFDDAVTQAVKLKLKGDGLPTGIGNRKKATQNMGEVLREHYNKG